MRVRDGSVDDVRWRGRIKRRGRDGGDEGGGGGDGLEGRLEPDGGQSVVGPLSELYGAVRAVVQALQRGQSKARTSDSRREPVPAGGDGRGRVEGRGEVGARVGRLVRPVVAHEWRVVVIVVVRGGRECEWSTRRAIQSHRP